MTTSLGDPTASLGSRPAARMLAEVAPKDLQRDPFVHVVRRQAIPVSLYGQLAEEFPPFAAFVADEVLGSNRAVRLSHAEVVRSRTVSPRWREFFDYHTSADYWRSLLRVFGADLRATFPELEAQTGRRFEDWRVRPRGADGDADVRLDCQFVMNTPVRERSSVKTPHVDTSDKIFSALLYFRDPRDTAAGSDLELYRWRRAPRFVKHRVLPGDVEHVATVPYAANTYCAFVNSAQSVHGVSPRDVTDVPRRYVNFIAEVPRKAFDAPQVSPWRRWWSGRQGQGGDEY